MLIFCFTLLPAQNSSCLSGNCENGSGTYVYRDGSTYSGDWKEGMKHGKGSFNTTVVLTIMANGKKIQNMLGESIPGQMGMFIAVHLSKIG